MRRLQIPEKLAYEKFYEHEIAVESLSKIYLLKNAKKICKPNNCNLNRNWIKFLRAKFEFLINYRWESFRKPYRRKFQNMHKMILNLYKV